MKTDVRIFEKNLCLLSDTNHSKYILDKHVGSLNYDLKNTEEEKVSTLLFEAVRRISILWLAESEEGRERLRSPR